MSKLTCFNCGKPIETIPTCCGYSFTFNSESRHYECDMGPKQGIKNIDKILCGKCEEILC